MLPFHACFLFCAEVSVTCPLQPPPLKKEVMPLCTCAYILAGPFSSLFVQEAMDMYIWSCLPSDCEHTFKRWAAGRRLTGVGLVMGSILQWGLCPTYVDPSLLKKAGFPCSVFLPLDYAVPISCCSLKLFYFSFWTKWNKMETDVVREKIANLNYRVKA